MNKIPESQILIIFGASGDLTYRKLIPRYSSYSKGNFFPTNF